MQPPISMQPPMQPPADDSYGEGGGVDNNNITNPYPPQSQNTGSYGGGPSSPAGQQTVTEDVATDEEGTKQNVPSRTPRNLSTYGQNPPPLPRTYGKVPPGPPSQVQTIEDQETSTEGGTVPPPDSPPLPTSGTVPPPDSPPDSPPPPPTSVTTETTEEQQTEEGGNGSAAGNPSDVIVPKKGCDTQQPDGTQQIAGTQQPAGTQTTEDITEEQTEQSGNGQPPDMAPDNGQQPDMTPVDGGVQSNQINNADDGNTNAYGEPIPQPSSVETTESEDITEEHRRQSGNDDYGETNDLGNY